MDLPFKVPVNYILLIMNNKIERNERKKICIMQLMLLLSCSSRLIDLRQTWIIDSLRALHILCQLKWVCSVHKLTNPISPLSEGIRNMQTHFTCVHSCCSRSPNIFHPRSTHSNHLDSSANMGWAFQGGYVEVWLASQAFSTYNMRPCKIWAPYGVH